MKKILALLLAGLMLFALAACGEDAKTDDGDKGGNGGDKTTASTAATKEDDSYVQALDDFMQGFYGLDVSKLDNAAPAGYLDQMFLEEAKRVAEMNYEDMVYVVGSDFTVVVKGATKTELSADAKAAIIEAFAQYEIEVEDVLTLNATIEFKTDSTTEEEPFDVKMAKVGGKWYVAEWMEYEGAYYEPSFKVMMMIGG